MLQRYAAVCADICILCGFALYYICMRSTRYAGGGTHRVCLALARQKRRERSDKKHPCGASSFEVLRVGMDFKIRCTGCGREVMLPRAKIEKNIKKVVKPGSAQ